MTKKLIARITKKDLDVQTFRSGGPGGQHQNKKDTGVRIIHRESGARGESREHRSQLQNRRAALERLTRTVEFKLWIARMAAHQITGKTLEERVDELMQPHNLRIEGVGPDGKWVEIE